MSFVWEHSQLGGTELLCLLAIADFADDRGIAYPSVATLAKKIRMSERNTHYLLSKLAQTDELSIDRNAGPKGCNVFRVKCLQGVQPVAGGGATGSAKGVQPIAPEPSLNRQRTVNKGFDLPSWIPQDSWDGWMAVRKSKKAANTPRALRLAISSLEKLRADGESVADVLDQSTLRGWTGLFPVKGRAGRSEIPGER